jgi:type III secretion system IpaD/SipD/SspD family effector
MSDMSVMGSGRSAVLRLEYPSQSTVAVDATPVAGDSELLDGMDRRSRQFASLAARLQDRASTMLTVQRQALPGSAVQAAAPFKVRSEGNALLLQRVLGQSERIAGDAVLQRMALLQAQAFADAMGAPWVRQGGAEQSAKAVTPEPAEVEVVQEQMERQIRAFAEQPSGAGSARASGDFFDSLQGLIDLIGSDYLAVYERLIQVYSDLYSDFNKEVMAKMSEWIKGVNDGKEVEFNAKAFRDAVIAIVNKYQQAPTGVAFPVPDEQGSIPPASKEEAAAWAKAMGISPDRVVQFRRGWVVMIDVGPLQEMWKSMVSQGDSIRWDSAKFQAWQTGFNTQEAEMKNYLQVATSKYSNANAYHDNFIKIMSSQLSQFAEMLKAYLT